jgi:hypothetical protein
LPGFSYFKDRILWEHEWPIILATQETEIRRITVQSQPGQIVHEALSRKKKKKTYRKGLVEWRKQEERLTSVRPSSNPSATKNNNKAGRQWLTLLATPRGRDQKDHDSKPANSSQDPISKNLSQK